MARKVAVPVLVYISCTKRKFIHDIVEIFCRFQISLCTVECIHTKDGYYHGYVSLPPSSIF